MNQNNFRKNKSKARSYRFTMGRAFEAVLALVFVVFLGRFMYISLTGQVDGENLAERTNQKYRQNRVLKARRGTIYDRQGDAIAEDSHVYSVYAVLEKTYIDAKGHPLYVTDKEKTAEKLATVLPMTKRKILSYLNPNKKAYQVEFGNGGKGLSLRQKHAIEKMHLTGIYFNDASSRLYPNGTFAANVVGLAQVDNNKKNDPDASLQGVMGLEKYFNKQLSGTNGLQSAKVDAYKYQLPNSQKVLKPAKDGDDLYLTLDSRLQNYMEQLLADAASKYRPKALTAVLMNAKTGKILAASQRPTFNPATKEGLDQSWRDMLVEDEYEPGSVFKILTLSAAIQSGIFNPNELYRSGAVTVQGSTIRDWNISGWGSIPFSEAFPRSSNVGMTLLEQRMGGTTWGSYLNKFHIGKRTGVTLPGETSGSLQFKSNIDRAVTSFGQGVNVNVMQMLQAFTAVANEGQMIKPQLVEKLVTPEGKTLSKFKRKTVGQPVITAVTAKKVLAAMQDVVNKEYGTGTVYKIPGYNIAAKTGTAQIANPNGGGYLTGNANYIFSVVGMAPASNPKYILYITMKQPQKMTQSAEVILSNMFNPLMKRVLEYEKDDDLKVQAAQVTVPQTVGQTTEAAKSTVDKAGLSAIVLGAGKTIKQQSLPVGQKIQAGSHLLMLTDGTLQMPDMTGWTVSDVKAFTTLTGVQVKTTGSGQVVKQNVKVGQEINTGTDVTIELKG